MHPWLLALVRLPPFLPNSSLRRLAPLERKSLLPLFFVSLCYSDSNSLLDTVPLLYLALCIWSVAMRDLRVFGSPEDLVPSPP